MLLNDFDAQLHFITYFLLIIAIYGAIFRIYQNNVSAAYNA